jgi:hypothetical protein
MELKVVFQCFSRARAESQARQSTRVNLDEADVHLDFPSLVGFLCR